MSTGLLAPSSPNSDRTASKMFFLRYTGDTVRSGSDGISLQIEISFAVSFMVDRSFLNTQISRFSASTVSRARSTMGFKFEGVARTGYVSR